MQDSAFDIQQAEGTRLAMLKEIQSTLQKHNLSEFILATKDGEVSLITPATQDLDFMLHTCTSLLHSVFKVPEQDIIDFYVNKGILVKNEADAQNS